MVTLWNRYRVVIVDIFVISNLAFLAVDIYFAHSINEFDKIAEWIPFLFSIVSPPILLFCLMIQSKRAFKKITAAAMTFIAYVSILIGITGLIFHLKSQFFEDMNIKNLVYTAPFMAPLAYSGLGFLILLNRKVSAQKEEWGQWIIFLALGGFFGNFILSLCDHAQNGFYYFTEWIPVIMSALAVGFLTVTLLSKPKPSFLNVVFVVLAAQIFIGILGFYFHLRVNLAGGSDHIFENFVYGAPIFAPLLFTDIAFLAIFGIYDIKTKINGDRFYRV